MSKEKNSPPDPRKASTVILIREHEGELQIYLLKRSSQSKFFPGNFVFPGGAVDSGDKLNDLWQTHMDIDPMEFDRRFGDGLTKDEILGYCIAAIRETFEEAGVLLASKETWDGDGFNRICLLRDQQKLPKNWLQEAAKTENWILSLSSLARWSQWITPELMKYRFNTFFFLAFMPEGRSCSPDNREMTDGTWVSPMKGLEGNLSGETPLSPPTIVTLQELLPFSNLKELEKELNSRPQDKPRFPRLVPSDNGPVILQPWDSLCDSDLPIDTRGLENEVLPPGEPFSRIWLNEGIWRPVRVREEK